MKAVYLVALLAACPALAEDSVPPTVTGNHLFRAYEQGLPAGADPGARQVSFRSVDTNHSGTWEPHEIERAFGHVRLDVLMTFDGNGDGYVTLNELRAYDDGGTGGPDGILKERVRG